MLLKAEGVTKNFDGLTAVKDVSFKVNEGDITGLVGPNGAGKTTLLNTISGIYTPNAGSIYFRGEDITKLKTYQICKRGIAKTFQLVQSFPELTAHQNVTVGALFGNSEKIRMDKAKDKATNALSFIGFPKKKFNHQIKNLNLVELKRIQLARALATDPRLLLLDEVTTGLNPTESQDAVKLIKKINESGTAILMVEHVMRIIMNVSDNIIVLHHGEKIAEGTPKEISNNKKVIDAYLGESLI